MNSIIQFILYALVAIALIYFWPKIEKWLFGATSHSKKTSVKSLSTKQVLNDKLIIIDDASDEDIQKTIQDFCNAYNEKEFLAIPRLIKLPGEKHAVIFHYDIDFETFCFFIHYIHNAKGIKNPSNATGWTTIKPGDIRETSRLANKHTMFYVSESNAEHDHVYLISSDNISFKYNFGDQSRLIGMAERPYSIPPISVVELEAMKWMEFR